MLLKETLDIFFHNRNGVLVYPLNPMGQGIKTRILNHRRAMDGAQCEKMFKNQLSRARFVSIPAIFGLFLRNYALNSFFNK